MNDRQISFLNKLLDYCKEYRPIDFFARELQVSSKTLRRDLEVLGGFLEGFKAAVERKNGVGIRLCIGRIEKKRLVNQITYLTYAGRGSEPAPWDKDSRRMDMAMNLLLYSDEYTSLSSLAYKYYVSKSTVNHDLFLLDNMLERFSLKTVRTVNGTIVGGDERNIRRAIVYILSCILDSKTMLAGDRGNIRSGGTACPNTLATILDIFRENDISLVNGLLCWIEERYQYHFNDSEFVNVSLNLLVMAYRLKNGCALNPQTGTYAAGPGSRKEIEEIAKEVSDRMLEHYGIRLPSMELEGIKNIMLVTHLLKPSDDIGEDGDVFQCFSEDFIDAFTTITNIGLRENPTFCENVISHINLMLNRLFSGTPASNPLMELLIKDYQSTLNVCRIICSILAEKFQLPDLSIDEISFLMLYILGETVRQSEHANVLFVTELSKSVANLMNLRLQQHFPQWNFDMCSPTDYPSIKKSTYDFCVSTAILEPECEGFPYVFVSPILENRDFQNIQELFWETSESAAVYQLDLVRLINDLHDIGCIIDFTTDGGRPASKVLIMIPALKDIHYIYSINEQEENHCTFVVDAKRERILEVYIHMSNLDFMLFSSKIVYLLDNCPNDVIPGFIHYFMEESRNV